MCKYEDLNLNLKLKMGKEKKDRASKSSSDKKSKPQSSKKKNGDKKKSTPEENSRKYGYISTSSVLTMGESIGIIDITEDAAKSLAEDVSYRLRHLIFNCSKYTKHVKRKNLMTEDVNRVLNMSDVQPLYGYNTSSQTLQYNYIKDADIYIQDDKIIDLSAYALVETSLQSKQKVFVRGTWSVAADCKQNTDKVKLEDNKNNVQAVVGHKNVKHHTIYNHVQTTTTASKTNIINDNNTKKIENNRMPNEHNDNEPKFNKNLIKYYSITCDTIIGHSDIKLVLQDLRKNNKMLPIIPYLLNFITITLNKLSSERQIKRLLQSVEALTENTTIDFGPYLPTSRVANAICMVIAVDKSVSFDFSIRYYAAQVLAKVLAKWCYRDEQKTTIILTMGKLLYDEKMSTKIHYGAMVLLQALGYEALHSAFYPLLPRLFTFLELKKACKKNVTKLEEAIFAAAALLYRSESIPTIKERKYSLQHLDYCLYEYFSDAICSIRLNPGYNSQHDRIKTRKHDDNAIRRHRELKYMRSRYVPHNVRPCIDHVFHVPHSQPKRNPRIVFKYGKPVPEMNLKRKRMEPRCSQFVPGKESEGHVVVVGKAWRNHHSCYELVTGNIFSII